MSSIIDSGCEDPGIGTSADNWFGPGYGAGQLMPRLSISNLRRLNDIQTDGFSSNATASTSCRNKSRGLTSFHLGSTSSQLQSLTYLQDFARSQSSTHHSSSFKGLQENYIQEAYPEDLQLASLRALQRRLRSNHTLPAPLREAAASVEQAGRLLQGWVVRRQHLSEEYPRLGMKLQHCLQKAQEAAMTEMEAAQENPETTAQEGAEEGENASPTTAEEGENPSEEGENASAEGGNATSAYAFPEGKQDSSGLSFLDLGQRLTSSFDGETLDQQMPTPGLAPDVSTNTEAPSTGPAEGELANAEAMLAEPGPPADVIQEEVVHDCNELTIQPSVLLARRSSSEAYWAFEKALSTAGKKVGQALDFLTVRGE